MKNKIRVLSLLLTFLMILPIIPVTGLIAWADGLEEQSSEREDAMTAINGSSELSAYKQGQTQTLANDGYIGIPVDVTVYYDASKGAAKPGYGGTTVVLYVVNTLTERIGTDSDVDIIKSMLDRGFIVGVADYGNNAKAVNPAIEYSVQLVRSKLHSGTFFTDKTLFPSGAYNENHAVPAGHNLSVNNVFYEIDKHGADGALERIVETWNNDFRGVTTTANKVIKWVDHEGNRKSTQNGWDGSEPVWYADAAGKTVDNENGQYIKVKHTWAKSITDCVKADGSPIDLNLYMHIVYPTNPGYDVPVMILAGSSEHLASGYAASDRPYLVGFSMNGYAIATYDFEYAPMARNDHYGYFSGDQQGGVTGTNGTFSIGTFNRSSYNTAAIRYLRYLSVTDHNTYSFDNERFGLFGNSKGGFQTFLGGAALRDSKTLEELGAGATKADLEAYIDDKVVHFYNDAYHVVMDPSCQVQNSTDKAEIYYYFNGSSRYQNGKTEDITVGSCVIDGGELQPWLTYTDENGVLREIKSGVQWIYSSCGGTTSHEWEGHAPVFTAANYYDSFGSGYSTHNYLANILRIYDIPSLFFEAPLEHSLVSGLDINHGVDTYKAFFNSADYYLKDEPISVVYTAPLSGDAGVKATEDILIRFYGPVSAEEIAKVTVTDQNGNAANGEWVSAYGKTEWVFKPVALNGGVRYDVTVPAELCGSNGKAMGADYTFSFYTKGETAAQFELATPVSVSDVNGTYFSFTVPSALNAPDNTLKLRFKVANAAANVAKIYKADSDTDTSGALLGSINLKGAGYYEYDVTDYVMSKTAGSTVYFLVKAEKAAADTLAYEHDFVDATGLTVNGTKAFVTKELGGENVTALEIIRKPGYGKYGAWSSYAGWYPVAFSTNKLINNGSAVTRADYGRTFTVTLRVYDTASRALQLWFNDCTNGSKTTGDYSYTRTIVHTKANEWIEVSVPYTVYEMDYGIESQLKLLKVIMLSTGSTEMPIYFDTLTVTEHVTGIEISEASLVSTAVGSFEYKAPTLENGFKVKGVDYTKLWDAIVATSWLDDAGFAQNPQNATITLLGDYVVETEGILAARPNLVIDLNGYSVTLKNQALLSLAAETADTCNITIKNGTLIVGDAPVIEHLRANKGAIVKEYNISFENVYITAMDGAATPTVITNTSSPNTATVTQNVTLTDCVVDIKRYDLPSTPIKIFPEGGTNLTTSYTFIGGELRVDSFVTLSLSDTVDGIEFKSGSDGKLTSLVTSSSARVKSDDAYMTDKGYASFTLTSTENGISTYELATPKYSTVYGVIPDDKTPEEWPFAIFKDGELIGLAKTYSIGSNNTENALYIARSKMVKDTDEEVQIVLRRDYDMTDASALDTAYENLAQIGGTLVIDLGEYTLTLKKGVPFLSILGKYGYDTVAQANHIYPSKIKVIGGTVVAASDYAPIQITSMVCDTADKQSKYDKAKVTDVEIAGTEFVVGDAGIINHGTSVNEQFGSEVTIDFQSCELDISAMSNGVIFNAQDGINMDDVSIKLSGGSIKANGLSGITLLQADADDSVIFCKGEGGAYTTLTMPSEVALTVFGGVNDAGDEVAFGNGVADGDSTVYTLGVTSIETKYGKIPAAYANTDDYPFAVFKDGEFVAAFPILIDTVDGDGVNSAMEQARALLYCKGTGTVQILLRRDYDTANDQNETFNNYSHIDGELIIDLDEHTLTNGKTAHNNSDTALFSISAKTSWDATLKKHVLLPTTIKMINGTLKTNHPLVVFATINSTNLAGAEGNERVSLVFEGLNVIYGDGNYSSLIANPSDSTAVPSKESFFNVTVNNCTLDITALGSKTVPLAVGLDKLGTNLNNLNVNIIGSKILTSQASVSLGEMSAKDGENGDSILLEKGENGYLEIQSTSVGAPTVGFPTAEGEKYYGRYSASDTVTVYRLGIRLEYGVVPDEYTDTDKYPWLLFDGKGNLVYATADFGIDNPIDISNTSALVQAKWQILKGNAPILLLRRDYTVTDGYNNLTQLEDCLVIDLGRNTLSYTTSYLFNATAKHAYVPGLGNYLKDTVITVRNGTVAVKGELINMNAGTNVDSYSNPKRFEFNFEDVLFDVAADSDSVILGLVGNSSNKTNVAYYDVNFTDCVVDLTKANKAIKLFEALDSGMIQADFTFNGGEIRGGSYALTVCDLAANDTFRFGKYEGEYTKLTLPKGISTPSQSFVTDAGSNYTFQKVGESGSTVIYTLMDNTFRIVSAYLNLNQDINVIYRAHVPAGFENPYMVFEFNGNTYRVEDFFIDGNGRYCFAFKNISPHMMGDVISATLYANEGAVSVSKESYSVKEYCAYQLANSTDAAVKTLVSDLLVYGAKAQLYMGYKTDALVTDGLTLTASEFTALDESANKLALSGTASELVGFSGVGLYLDNDINLKLTFTAQSAEGLTVEIKVGDKETAVLTAADWYTDGEGNYRIYFDGIMATEFDETVTVSFKINGVAVGPTLTYSVNSYVYYMQGSSDGALVDLVKAIYSYGVSAEAYALSHSEEQSEAAKAFSALIAGNTGTQIKLLGDSITHGVGGTGFAQDGETIVGSFKRNPDGYCWANLFSDYMAENYACTVVNNACSGRDIEFIISNFDTLVDAEDDLIICAIGTNNRHQYTTENGGVKYTEEEFYADFYSNILTLNGMFEAAGKTVIFIANIPASEANEQDGSDYWRVLHMDDIRDAYMEASDECGFPMINLYDMFNAYCEENGIELDSLLSDGLHPNDTGYEIMFELIIEALGA